MKQRVIMVLGAAVMSAIVLTLAIMFGQGPTPDDSTLPALRTGDLPPGLQPGQITEPSDQPFQAADEGFYVMVKGDRRTVLTWQHLTPKPQGVSDVIEPTATIHFSQWQILTIRSDEGTFLAPENQPRSGEFRDNVVVTLYRRDDKQPVTLDGTADIAMRLFLDQAQFDLELGQIDSRGPLHMTGPRFDFRGTGLSLTYNHLRDRIERLEVFQGDTLRLARAAKPTPNTDPERSERAGIADNESDTTTSHAGPEQSEGPGIADQEPDPPTPPLFYKSRFAENVVVTTMSEDGTGQTRATGDNLEVIFSLDNHKESSASDTTTTSRPRPQSDSPAPVTPASNAPSSGDLHTTCLPTPTWASLAGLVLMQLDANATADEADGPLFVERDDDIVIRWTGRLLLEPEQAPDSTMTNADDFMLRMLGQTSGAMITNDQGVRLTGELIEHHTRTGATTARAGATLPMVLDDPAMGRVTGSHLHIDPATQTGFVDGPGRITQWEYDQAGDLQAGADGQADAPPTASPMAGLSIDFVDRLDLGFYPNTDNPTTPGPIRFAAFKDNVQTRHPQFDLDSNKLRLAFDEPTPGRPQQLQQVLASGDVQLLGEQSPTEPTVDLQSQQLDIAMTVDDAGQSYPAAIFAQQQVRLIHGQMDLTSDQLDIQLRRRPHATPHAGPERSEGPGMANHGSGIVVERLIATDLVRLTMIDSGLVLTGQKLDAQADSDQLEIFGPAHRPATATRDNHQLTGQHIVMSRRDQTVHVPGPGQFVARGEAPATPESQLFPGLAAEPEGDMLVIDWQRAMHYDHQAAIGNFTGNVVANNDQAGRLTRLTGDQMNVEFDRDEPASATAVNTDVEPDIAGSTGQWKRVTVRDNGVLIGQETLAPTDEPNPPQQRSVRIEGPIISIDRPSDQLQVIGAGRMLIDQPASTPHAGPEQSEGPGITAPDSPTPIDTVGITGEGQTAFGWAQQMTLDRRASRMTMHKDVWMLHQPADTTDALSIKGQKLVAVITNDADDKPDDADDAASEVDATASQTDPAKPDADTTSDPAAPTSDDGDTDPAGLAVSDARTPLLQGSIERFAVDDDVIVRRASRTVFCDHLLYLAKSQTIDLIADDGGTCLVLDSSDDSRREAKRFIWDLTKNQLDARGVVGGRSPIR